MHQNQCHPNHPMLRIFIYEDDETISKFLKSFIETLGHEAYTFSDPTFCPGLSLNTSNCQNSLPCADAILSDIMMPNLNGIEFYALLKHRGCKIFGENMALMSASVKHSKQSVSRELGIAFFRKPFNLSEITEWLSGCAERVPKDRKLSFLNKK